MSKLVSNYFNSNGTWTCPAGVTEVYVLAHGGGGGGSGGTTVNSEESYGGDGTTPVLVPVPVVPNTTYTIIIGQGGTGGAPRTSTVQNGGTGGDTLFGSLVTFRGSPVAGGTIPSGMQLGRVPSGSDSPFINNRSSGFITAKTGRGDGESVGGKYYWGGDDGTPGFYGSTIGSGGDGGIVVGGNAVSGTGYGYGGSGGGSGPSGGGFGADGGSGQMWIIWVE